MAIRISNKKGIADTQAELLASTQADDILFFCTDTGVSFVSFDGDFIEGVHLIVEDNVTVIPTVQYYIIDTSNAGFDITVTLTDSLPEGVPYFFKRQDNSPLGAYKIFFDTPTYTVDHDNNFDNEFLKNDYDAISLIRTGSVWSIK